ncbi:MAG: type II toxin-antitoxin system RelE/ParE family toxin [Elusimicrobia bacterium]|nr:type II toxin-antitoxin system RelE/ParE family toxin [Elusimicrobiota bacterium]
MPAYSVGFASDAVQKHFLKGLACLPRPVAVRIKEAVDSLADDPRPQGKRFKFLRPPVSIAHLVATHRLRVGDYRILYDVDDDSKRVVLLALRRRSEGTYRH